MIPGLDGLVSAISSNAWLALIAVLVVLSWGWRSRSRLSTSDTQRSVQALGRPARKDVKRVGGVFTGFLFFVWVVAQEFANLGGDVMGLAGEVAASFAGQLAYFATIGLGYLGMEGSIQMTNTQYLGLALFLGALVLMVKN